MSKPNPPSTLSEAEVDAWFSEEDREDLKDADEVFSLWFGEESTPETAARMPNKGRPLE